MSPFTPSFSTSGRVARCGAALLLSLGSLTLWAQLPSGLPVQGSVRLQKDGAQELALAADWERGGQRFPQGSRLVFRADGHLDHCVLSRDATFSGMRFPAGTTLSWGPQDTLAMAFLSRDCTLQGHLLKGHGHDWMTRFHPNGQLQLGWLAQDERIDGIPCARTRFWREFLHLPGRGGTSFHPNGRLASATLAEDAVVQGKRQPAGTRIQLDPEGRLLAP